MYDHSSCFLFVSLEEKERRGQKKKREAPNHQMLGSWEMQFFFFLLNQCEM